MNQHLLQRIGKYTACVMTEDSWVTALVGQNLITVSHLIRSQETQIMALFYPFTHSTTTFIISVQLDKDLLQLYCPQLYKQQIKQDKAYLGQQVLVGGFPERQSLRVQYGIVSKLMDGGAFQVNCELSKGYSGGGVWSRNGSFLGRVIYNILSQEKTLGGTVCIPLDRSPPSLTQRKTLPPFK